MTNDTPVVEIHPEVATSKTKAFFARHKTKMVGTALTAGAVAFFVLGRRSNDIVEGSDSDENTTDSKS